VALFDSSEWISTRRDRIVLDCIANNIALIDLDELFSTMQIEATPIAVFQEKAVPAGTRLA
jgi:hypothetical protein